MIGLGIDGEIGPVAGVVALVIRRKLGLESPSACLPMYRPRPSIAATGPSGLPKLLLLGGLPTLLGGLLVLTAPAHASPSGGSTTPTLGEALAPSNADQLQLTEHLRQIGAMFYGAWWCPACFRQKSLFGQQAGDRLPYVECDKTDHGRERCRTAGIKAYPTWVLGDRRVEGVQTLEQLKRWSGFSSPRRP